ncbi:MAG: hypothetical protein HOV94_39175, partial [Saccharothrix sp.]|nr:hypothetical protein [Saccharothrix sp.]
PDPAVEHRTSPAGWWRVDAPVYGVDGARGALEPLRETARRVAELPRGAFADDDTELALIEYLALVNSFEGVYRTGELVYPAGDDATVFADWRGLLARGRGDRTRHALHALVHDPARTGWGFSSPAIVHRWAEADVLLGPDHDGGYTLVDVKTVTTVADARRTARWLWQTLLYAWLDTGDRWHIRRIGLWLARHGVIVSWDLEQVEDVLLGTGRWRRTAAVRRARSELLRHAAQAITTDGGTPPAAWIL